MTDDNTWRRRSVVKWTPDDWDTPCVIDVEFAKVNGEVEIVAMTLRSYVQTEDRYGNLADAPTLAETNQYLEPKTLRKVPYRTVMDLAKRDAVEKLDGSGRILFHLERYMTPAAAEKAKAVKAELRDTADAVTKSGTRRGPKGHPDTWWQAVADVYLANPEKPVKAVREFLRCSPGTATQTVYRTRQKGFLPATSPGAATNIHDKTVELGGNK